MDLNVICLLYLCDGDMPPMACKVNDDSYKDKILQCTSIQVRTRKNLGFKNLLFLTPRLQLKGASKIWERPFSSSWTAEHRTQSKSANSSHPETFCAATTAPIDQVHQQKIVGQGQFAQQCIFKSIQMHIVIHFQAFCHKINFDSQNFNGNFEFASAVTCHYTVFFL